MQELASARRSEKSASEKASSFRLQASAFKQELIAAKSMDGDKQAPMKIKGGALD